MASATLDKTAEDLRIGREILSNIGPLNITALDVDRGFVFIEDRAVSLRNVIIGFRKRGTVDIAQTQEGLYDITVTRVTKKGMQVFREWKGVFSADIRPLLGRLWTYTA